MKYSQFNSVISYQNNFLLYNSFTNSYLVIQPFLKDLLEASRYHNEIDDLANVHPLFYNDLIKNGFFVENSEDEVQKVRSKVEVIDNTDQEYTLTINPTMNCNFKCWYCYETHIKKSNMEEANVAKTKALISNILSAENLKLFKLQFFGGEPLLNYQDAVKPILSYCLEKAKEKDINLLVSITTNGYLINESMLPLFHAVGPNNIIFQITLDGSEDDHDSVRFVSKTKGSYKEILDRIRLLLKSGLLVRARINYTIKNIQKCVNIIEDFKALTHEEKSRLIFSFHRVWQDSQAKDYANVIEPTIKYFKNQGFNVKTEYSLDSVNNSCYGDKLNSAVVNFNGDVYKCTARDFTSDSKNGVLSDNGSIDWNQEMLINRMNVKFKNKPCLSCKILPICNGGCSQHAYENLNGPGYCVYNFDENKKDRLIISRFEEILHDHNIPYDLNGLIENFD
ncbi:radical SAM/SPASM domain-containing protein [Pedobacter sp. D749]|uniref:radical SAM/SPASM domain-containing protein n=1 Tax=Pedobacter sp. D749 TaxID=2856523 RepID=UPI001C598BA6|nr:radical SAM protein [Pedobacter sp. D749]QXU40617.1 SPASM domain-containing protein [Pedobacter sp. D749]